MTKDIIEIKAMSVEEAKKRAMRVLDIQENQILNAVEKVKSKSFFGFFAKEGIYEIEYTEEKNPEENKNIKPKNIARDLRKERAEKLASEKEKIKTEKTKEESVKKQQPKVEKIEKFEKEKNEPKENLKKEIIKDMPVNEEKVKEIIERAKELLNNMGLNLDVEFVRMDGKNYIINLSGEDKGIIIGKKGKTLNSFEYLLNSLIKDARIDVDVEGFKEKRTDTLVELANKMAMKAIKTKRVVRLNPMPPRERKIIHEIINKYPELDTFSEGRDPKRYIVIKRKNK